MTMRKMKEKVRKACKSILRLGRTKAQDDDYVTETRSCEKTASLNASHSQRHGTKEGSTSHGSNSLQSTGWQFPQAAECVIDSLAPIPSTDSSNMAIEPPLSGPKASSIWRKRFSRSKSAIKSGLNSLNCASLFHPGRSGNLRARRNRSVIENVTVVGSNSVPESECGHSVATSSQTVSRLRARVLSRAMSTKVFNEIWEETALPALQETMKQNWNEDYSITVQFDYHLDERVIEIMTTEVLPTELRKDLENSVQLFFEVSAEDTPLLCRVSVHFFTAKVDSSCATSCATNGDDDTGWSLPSNHSGLMLGDSIGPTNDNYASTMAPVIQFGGQHVWLVSRSLFDNKLQSHGSERLDLARPHDTFHPAQVDYDAHRRFQHNLSLQNRSAALCRSTRASRTLKDFAGHKALSRVVTDWAICASKDEWIGSPNRLRYTRPNADFHVRMHPKHIPGIFLQAPQLRIVSCAGRDRGIGHAVVCETPALVHHSGRTTREWYVENATGFMSTDTRNEEEFGQHGDSGAAVVDDETGRLIGQVWGRNLFGNHTARRVAYFTHIMDIFDDIKDQYPESGYPTLIGQTDPAWNPAPFTDEGIGTRGSLAEPDLGGQKTPSSSRFSSSDSSFIDDKTTQTPALRRFDTDNCDEVSEPNVPLDPGGLSILQSRLFERQQTSPEFNHILETEVLPLLRQTIDDFNVDYNISMQAEYGHPQLLRVVEVTSSIALPEDSMKKLSEDIGELFESKPTLWVSVAFSVGAVERSIAVEDVYIDPRNGNLHSPIMVGDSVGYKNGDCAATVGPLLRWNGKVGVLVNYHLFHEAGLELHIVHPAEIDSETQDSKCIGRLCAHSGDPMFGTQRISKSIERFFGRQERVETDWAFCELTDNGEGFQNRLRHAPNGTEFESCSEWIPGVFEGDPRLRIVRCAGRSSGLVYGVVSESLAVVKKGLGEPTREWCLERIKGLPGTMVTDQWNCGGIGIPGDSGAVFIDNETERIVGQVWGRNVYGGDRTIPRQALFTMFTDIQDDVEDRYPGTGRPVLVERPSTPEGTRDVEEVEVNAADLRRSCARGIRPKRRLVKEYSPPEKPFYSTRNLSGATLTESMDILATVSPPPKKMDMIISQQSGFVLSQLGQ